jgi:hypothetical protein
MAEMKPTIIDGSVTLRFGGTEVTRKFGIPLSWTLDTHFLNGDLPGFMKGEIKVDAESFRREIDALITWLESFPAELENG